MMEQENIWMTRSVGLVKSLGLMNLRKERPLHRPKRILLELKLGELNQDHLDQLEDYLNETHQIEKLIDIEKNDLKYIGVLVGKAIDKDLADKISAGYLITESIPVAALTPKRYRGQDSNIYVITGHLLQEY
jgi:hypothetical protein